MLLNSKSIRALTQFLPVLAASTPFTLIHRWCDLYRAIYEDFSNYRKTLVPSHCKFQWAALLNSKRSLFWHLPLPHHYNKANPSTQVPLSSQYRVIFSVNQWLALLMSESSTHKQFSSSFLGFPFSFILAMLGLEPINSMSFQCQWGSPTEHFDLDLKPLEVFAYRHLEHQDKARMGNKLRSLQSVF